ncbi:MAG: HAMP domain-containing histidine kinase [Ruminococcus sp.]|nr:HAMP domain-containing histidine kinase [Ruminococcus sp.]
MHFIIGYFRQRRKGIFVFFLFCLVFLCAFLLYRLPAGAVLYPAFVCMVLGLLFLISGIRREWLRHRRLEELGRLPSALQESFPEPITVEDRDYQQIISRLCEEQKQLETQMNLRYSDMIDYYTVWAHQIKTPIASMRLNLQNQDSEFARRILEDLARIERYVEMVMGYLRLDSDFTDYVIREYDLDEIVKQTVKKFAGQFIRKKLQLDYRPLHTRAVTDEKWLQFVLEQVISNSLKYTESGRITIEMESDAMAKEAGDAILCIRDTGIGIAPEDIPRIFEKGYTGYNGRSDKKASGIGLYLCRRICDNLGHVITANSSLENGTVIRIRFKGPRSR